jgi:hypothetical protein
VPNSTALSGFDIARIVYEILTLFAVEPCNLKFYILPHLTALYGLVISQFLYKLQSLFIGKPCFRKSFVVLHYLTALQYGLINPQFMYEL